MEELLEEPVILEEIPKKKIRSLITKKEEREMLNKELEKYRAVYEEPYREFSRSIRFKEGRITGFEIVAEKVFSCERSGESDNAIIYHCEFTVTPDDTEALTKSKPHRYTIKIYKTNGRAAILSGNLIEPIKIDNPIDLLNGFYILFKWNVLRDETISEASKMSMYIPEYAFSKIWEKFKQHMKEENVPIDVFERKAMKITIIPPKHVIDTVSRKLDMTPEELGDKYLEIKDEVDKKLEEYTISEEELSKLLEKKKGKYFTLEELFKELKK